jgi:hypothetical protein
MSLDNLVPNTTTGWDSMIPQLILMKQPRLSITGLHQYFSAPLSILVDVCQVISALPWRKSSSGAFVTYSTSLLQTSPCKFGSRMLLFRTSACSLSFFRFPPLFSYLKKAIIDGSVTIVDASKYSCDTLIKSGLKGRNSVCHSPTCRRVVLRVAHRQRCNSRVCT